MKKNIVILIIFSILFGCKTKNKTYINTDNIIDSVILPKAPENLQIESDIYSTYKIPLPVDIINFLKDTKVFYDDIINPLSSYTTHNTSISKALNLGVYTADLTYCSVLKQGQTSVEYYELCYNVSKDLSINDGFTDAYFKRMNNNLDNNDSLIALANESYNRACKYLENQGRNNILPFIIIGGWYESLSIIILSGKKGKIQKEKVRNFILEQQTGVENLIKYLYDVQIETSAFAYHKELSKFIDHLQKLKGLYQDYRRQQDTNVYNALIDEIIQMRKMIVNDVIK